jgi:hypothetical protein
MAFGPNSPLYGMSQTQLQTLLAQAQTAYGNLMMGARAVNLSYSQGDGGSKSVTYDRIEGGVAQLRIFIQELQQALGITRRLPRRFVRVGMGWR